MFFFLGTLCWYMAAAATANFLNANVPATTTKKTTANTSLQLFTTTLLHNTSLQHFSTQHFPTTLLCNAWRNTSLQHCTTIHPVLLRTTKYYSVLQSTTPYYKTLLQYYSVLLQYYSVLQSTTSTETTSERRPSSTTPYYKVLLQYCNETTVRLCLFFLQFFFVVWDSRRLYTR